MNNNNVASETNQATFTAQDYAELGFAPIRLYGVNPDGSCQCPLGRACPERSRGKHPIGGGWQNAPIVAKAVDKHVARGGNVGLRMGDQPGGARYVALDEDAEGALANGEELWGPLPETLTSRTGSGGRHCIYEWPADKPYPSNKVRSNGLTFDVRGQDSQIVAAPSRNVNGRYSWTRFDVPAALPAAWVAALLADSGKRTGPRKAGKLPHVAIADPDERTAALVEALAPFWEPPDPNAGRRMRLRAFGGYLARRGWCDEQIAAFVRALPTARPESERVSLAIECAQQARGGDDDAAGWTTLEAWNADAAAAIESIAKDPREPSGFTGVWCDWWLRAFSNAGDNGNGERDGWALRMLARGRKMPAKHPIYEPREEASITITPRSAKRKRKLTGWVARMIASLSPAAHVPAQGEAPSTSDAVPATSLEASDDWYTMAEDLERVRAVLGAIDLDPASCPAANASVGAARIYTIEDDGLVLPWAGRVYCNPPFSKGMRDRFVDKAIASAATGAEIMFLCDFDHSTAWCQRLMQGCAAYALPKWRLKFWKPGGARRSPKCGQIVAYFGTNVGRFSAAYETSAQVTVNGASK